MKKHALRLHYQTTTHQQRFDDALKAFITAWSDKKDYPKYMSSVRLPNNIQIGRQKDRIDAVIHTTMNTVYNVQIRLSSKRDSKEQDELIRKYSIILITILPSNSAIKIRNKTMRAIEYCNRIKVLS